MDKKQIRQIIADNVRTLMNQQELSTTEFAKRSNITTGTVSKIINADMNITVPMALNITKGLGVDIHAILKGLPTQKAKENVSLKVESNQDESFSIGILSINNKRITCIKNHADKIIGRSELKSGLDLTETSGSLIQLIHESIYEALKSNPINDSQLKQAYLKLVTQSYEFEDTRNKFVLFAKKYFKDVILIPDWQITYLADFKNNPGISLVTDKGVSLSYRHNGRLKKIGGWKFPVYDLGGENWLGVETIRHTIEATEGYIPMSNLARNVLAKFNGKVEKITETCFKGAKDPDIYCLFAELLLRSYFTRDNVAKSILERGFQLIYRSVERVDSILGKPLKIAINGSLADIYRPFFQVTRLIIPSSETEKTELLADITQELLAAQGVSTI